MNIVYVTGYNNAHLCAIADELFELTGNNFTLIETIPQPADVYKANCFLRPYVFKAWESNESEKKARKMIYDADIVRIGGANTDYVDKRIKDGKITFRSCERWFKKPAWKQLWNPLIIRSMYKNHFQYNGKPFYLLSMSAFCANDARIIHSYKNKVLEFGYFIPVPDYNIEDLMAIKHHDRLKMLWCARNIDWKHPEMIPLLAKKLIDNGYKSFEIDMIGVGNMYDKIKEMINSLNLNDCVHQLGRIPNSAVQERMKEANIFLFTSDREEGWGVVQNEAMAAGCAVVTSNAIGSTPYLIENNKNGLIFESQNIKSLYNKVILLFNDDNFRETISRNAYHTIKELCPKNVAKRFYQLCEFLLNGGNVGLFNDGPCSKASPCNPKELL